MQANQVIDLRSDTVTRPTEVMRELMANAEVGDDVYGEDPTVTALEHEAARRFGKEAALFVSSGTQGNLLALLAHCQRGDEFIVGHRMHSFRSEAGGAAVLGGISPCPIEAENGVPSVAEIEAAIKPDDFHFARTRLICLENTQSGRVLDVDYIDAVGDLADAHGLSVHLDGARVFNASVKTGVPVDRITRDVDTVSVCLSKGLGAPVGSVLCGSESFVAQTRRLRKLVGGAMRQAGIIASAGLHVLNHHVDRLADDHENAARLAEGLQDVLKDSTLARVDPARTETNMAFLHVDDSCRAELIAALKAQGIFVSSNNPIRLVTHLDVDAPSIERTIAAVGEFFAARGR